MGYHELLVKQGDLILKSALNCLTHGGGEGAMKHLSV